MTVGEFITKIHKDRNSNVDKSSVNFELTVKPLSRYVLFSVRGRTICEALWRNKKNSLTSTAVCSFRCSTREGSPDRCRSAIFLLKAFSRASSACSCGEVIFEYAQDQCKKRQVLSLCHFNCWMSQVQLWKTKSRKTNIFINILSVRVFIIDRLTFRFSSWSWRWVSCCLTKGSSSSMSPRFDLRPAKCKRFLQERRSYWFRYKRAKSERTSRQSIERTM